MNTARVVLLKFKTQLVYYFVQLYGILLVNLKPYLSVKLTFV